MSASKKTDYKGALIAVLVLPLVLPLIAVAILLWLFASAPVLLAVLVFWRTRGITYLIVYSESAQWKQYFEEEVVPAFGSSARVINLSTDGGAKKRWHLDWWVYRHCSGYRNRFPIVLRFSAFGTWKAVRFYDAFIQAKKGKPELLEGAQAAISFWKPKTASPKKAPKA